MFEGVLYFVLGFLASAMIALMVSPAIWNRAVVLTKRRIESSVPLTLNEVQADKDQLRAEFAMSTRRLELSLEELQEKTSRQVIEINRKRDELALLAEESRDKIRTVEELEQRSSDLRSRLADREEALASISKSYDETRQKLEQRALELDQMHRKYGEAQSDADSRRIELVTKQTSVDDLTDRLHAHEADKLRLTGELESLNRRHGETEERLARLQKLNADLEEKIQRSERDMAAIRKSGKDEENSSNELTRLLMEERKKTTDLESKLAKSTLRMESLLSDASNENVAKAMENLTAEKKAMQKKLAELTSERDKLDQEVREYRESSGVEWETERKENAVLRERINDLAAQVTAMTAAIEGPESPINEILQNLEQAARKPGKKGSADDNGPTLADRVRALQESARIKEA